MIKYISGIAIAILLACPTVIADDDYDAVACNHNTGKCYEAEVDLTGGYVTIEFKDDKGNDHDIKLELDNYEDKDLTAYHEEEGVYYDIEITDDD